MQAHTPSPESGSGIWSMLYSDLAALYELYTADISRRFFSLSMIKLHSQQSTVMNTNSYCPES